MSARLNGQGGLGQPRLSPCRPRSPGCPATAPARARVTRTLAMLRGMLLDLLATEDVARVDVANHLNS